MANYKHNSPRKYNDIKLSSATESLQPIGKRYFRYFRLADCWESDRKIWEWGGRRSHGCIYCTAERKLSVSVTIWDVALRQWIFPQNFFEKSPPVHRIVLLTASVNLLFRSSSNQTPATHLHCGIPLLPLSNLQIQACHALSFTKNIHHMQSVAFHFKRYDFHTIEKSCRTFPSSDVHRTSG
jgi:hypothetical protein